MNDYTNSSDTTASDGLYVSPSIKNDLRDASGWAKFLAIVGFIASGFLFLAALVLMFVGGTMFESLGSGAGSIFAGPFIGIIYLVIALLYLFPCLYLYRYADRSKKAVTSGTQTDLENAITNLRKLFKFVGIYTLIILSFYIIFFLFAVVFGAFSAL